MNIKFSNRRGLPGGPNEVTSKGSISVEGYKEGSPDFNNDFNIIESSNITMEGVPFPVMGTDNFGNSEIMMPDLNYQFPGDIVIEIPLAQIGGAMDTAYDDHPFEKFAESQGMDVQEALQIVLSSPQAYPIEIVQAARDYQLERKRTNPVNDKQDEAFYSTRDQQELEEAQDGTETKYATSSDEFNKLNQGYLLGQTAYNMFLNEEDTSRPPAGKKEKLISSVLPFKNCWYNNSCVQTIKDVFNNAGIDSGIPEDVYDNLSFLKNYKDYGFELIENASEEDMRMGDIIQFHYSEDKYPYHIGMYIADDQYISDGAHDKPMEKKSVSGKGEYRVFRKLEFGGSLSKVQDGEELDTVDLTDKKIEQTY